MALFRTLAGSLRHTSNIATGSLGQMTTAAVTSTLRHQQQIHTTVRRLNSSIINIQDSDDFTERVANNSLPVIVDFHATWCGPCKILGPRLEALVAEQEGKVIMAKVDIDELSDIAIDHGVEAVPTVLAMKQGQILDKFVGVKDNDQLASFVNKLIGQ